MIIRNARFYLNGRLAQKDIKIEDGAISGIGSFSGRGSGEEIDAGGLFAFPGLIDPHVHLRDPGLTRKEDFHTGTRAALYGGFTTVLDMPNTRPPTTTKKALAEKEKIAKKKAVCDYGLHFGAAEGNFSEVKKANPASLKLYMGQSTGSMQVGEDAARKHFSSFPKERPIILHAEDGKTVKEMEDSGQGRGPLAENVAIGKAISMGRGAGGRMLYFAHTTTSRAVSLAKSYPNSVVEVSPHHLFLSIDTDVRRLGGFSIVYPPLRREQDRALLMNSLPRIDVVGSDHAPHTKEDKLYGAAGFPGLEASLALFLDAYNKSMVSLPWIVSRMAENPARIFGIKNKGRIAKGYDGDITLVDLREEWVVRAENLESRCGWSPYEGMRLRGRVKKVVLRGSLVVDDSEIVDEVYGESVF